MKKIFAIVLVLLMLLPMIASCNKNPPEESSSSEQSQQSQSQQPSESQKPQTPSGDSEGKRGAGNGFSSKDTVLDSWSGKTLNVLVTDYSGAIGVWSQVELDASAFGETIKANYDDRQAEILDKYGVTVNWIRAQRPQNVVDDLTTASTSQSASYEIAYPRATEVQALVALVYDMNNSEYLDFNQSYFNQASYDTYTVYNHTLFVAGDFDYNDEQVSYMLFLNKDMLGDYGIESDTLYQAVKDGSWTYETLKNISRNVSSDNGDGQPGDEDTYGFATKSFSRFYTYAGILESDVDPDTTAYRVALNLDEEKVAKVIENIIECKTSSWARGTWGGDWGANATAAFVDQRVLFLDEVAQNFDHLGTITFSLGVLPFPKLNEEQDRYYTPLSNAQTTFVCVPKATSDKDFSFYFVDVLAWTGEKYMIPAYIEDRVIAKLDIETADEDVKIIQDYIFDNIVYDAGYLSSGWAGFLDGVKNDSHANNTNNFTQAFGNASEQAMTTLEGWNIAWSNYYEDIE